VEQAKATIEEELKLLVAWLRQVDAALRRGDALDRIKFLVARLEGIEIRMEGDKKHARPHVHIKYKKDAHIASFAIDDGSRLTGASLPMHCDPIIALWIKKIGKICTSFGIVRKAASETKRSS
jgi:hypothetical protein